MSKKKKEIPKPNNLTPGPLTGHSRYGNSYYDYSSGKLANEKKEEALRGTARYETREPSLLEGGQNDARQRVSDWEDFPLWEPDPGSGRLCGLRTLPPVACEHRLGVVLSGPGEGLLFSRDMQSISEDVEGGAWGCFASGGLTAMGL